MPRLDSELVYETALGVASHLRSMICYQLSDGEDEVVRASPLGELIPISVYLWRIDPHSLTSLKLGKSPLQLRHQLQQIFEALSRGA